MQKNADTATDHQFEIESELESELSKSASRPSSRKSSLRRLILLLLSGLLILAIGLSVRNSRWARERQLRSLNVEELALAVHDHPRDALTWYLYGEALRKANRLDMAGNALQLAIKFDPRMAEPHLEMGNLQMQLGQGELAKKSFEEAIRLAPKETRNYLALAKATYVLGSPKQAIEPLKKILEIEPRNVYAWYTLGKMYGESHQSDLAYDALKRAVDIDPKQALCWRDLAQVSHHYSRFAEAEEQFQKAIALDPKDPIAHYWMGQMYLEKGDPDATRKARQHLDTALQLAPNMAESHFEMGRLLERQQDYRSALTEFDKARTLDNSNDQALYHYGLALVRIGKKAEGERYIAGAEELAQARHLMEDTQNQIRNDPQNRPLRLRLARLFRKYGNVSDAIVEYQTYQRLGSEDPAVTREMKSYQEELMRRPKP